MSGSPHGVFGGTYVVAGFAGALDGAGACATSDTEAAATTAARSIIRLNIGPSRSDFDDRHELLDRGRRLLESRVFFGRELDLDALLEALRALLTRDADEQIADAVLPLQEHGARDNLVF